MRYISENASAANKRRRRRLGEAHHERFAGDALHFKQRISGTQKTRYIQGDERRRDELLCRMAGNLFDIDQVEFGGHIRLNESPFHGIAGRHHGGE